MDFKQLISSITRKPKPDPIPVVNDTISHARGFEDGAVERSLTKLPIRRESASIKDSYALIYPDYHLDTTPRDLRAPSWHKEDLTGEHLSMLQSLESYHVFNTDDFNQLLKSDPSKAKQIFSTGIPKYTPGEVYVFTGDKIVSAHDLYTDKVANTRVPWFTVSSGTLISYIESQVCTILNNSATARELRFKGSTRIKSLAYALQLHYKNIYHVNVVSDNAYTKILDEVRWENPIDSLHTLSRLIQTSYYKYVLEAPCNYKSIFTLITALELAKLTDFNVAIAERAFYSYLKTNILTLDSKASGILAYEASRALFFFFGLPY